MEEPKRKPRKHRRGEGTTYPDGAYWVAAYSLGIDRRTGKRRIVKRKVGSPREADAALTILRRRYQGVGPVALLTLAEYMADWLEAVRPTIAPRTYESYAGLWEHHVDPLLGGIRLADLRAADARRLIRECLASGLSASSTQRVVAVLRVSLGQAVEDGELPTNVAKVKLPRVQRERVEAMTLVQAERILDAVKGHHLEAIITLLLGCGLRVGEATALDWRDLHLPPLASDVTVRLGKTRSSRRTVPLPAFVAAAMLAHRAASPRYGDHEPVFLGASGERQRADVVSHAFPKLLVAKGQPRITVHQLRHGTATLLVARGVPLPVVAAILGHADPAMTVQVYAHVAPDSKRRAMTQMDAIRQA